MQTARPVQRRRRRNPLPALVAVVVVPALPLAGVVIWARGTASVDPPPANAPIPADRTVVRTRVLSLRRAPDTLAQHVNVAALDSALDGVDTLLNDASCLQVDIDGVSVHELRDETPVIPASNSKILTGAVALDLLGPDFRFVTTAVGALDGDTVQGDLVLVGGGDPLLATDFYPDSLLGTKYAQRPATRLEDLADAVVAAGVRTVSGRVLGDESRYDTEYYRPAWPDSLHKGVAGPYSALLVNDGWVSPSDGGPVDVPAQGAADLFADLLQERGVTIAGGTGVGVAPDGGAEVARVKSAPFSEVLGHMMATSDNNSAEMLLKEIAVGSGRPGTAQDGLDVVVSTLGEWGLPTDGVVPTDGSGLDIESRETCAVLTGALARSGVNSVLTGSLPLLGREGTLATYLTDHPLAGVARAKTGSLGEDADRTDVKALSGIVPVEGAPGGGLVFSMVLNGGTVRDPATFVPLWDELFDALATYPAGPSVGDLAPAAPRSAS